MMEINEYYALKFIKNYRGVFYDDTYYVEIIMKPGELVILKASSGEKLLKENVTVLVALCKFKCDKILWTPDCCDTDVCCFYYEIPRATTPPWGRYVDKISDSKVPKEKNYKRKARAGNNYRAGDGK